jgi:hypothetical protein
LACHKTYPDFVWITVPDIQWIVDRIMRDRVEEVEQKRRMDALVGADRIPASYIDLVNEELSRTGTLPATYVGAHVSPPIAS